MGFEGIDEGNSLWVILGVNLEERGGFEGGFIVGDEELDI